MANLTRRGWVQPNRSQPPASTRRQWLRLQLRPYGFSMNGEWACSKTPRGVVLLCDGKIQALRSCAPGVSPCAIRSCQPRCHSAGLSRCGRPVGRSWGSVLRQPQWTFVRRYKVRGGKDTRAQNQRTQKRKEVEADSNNGQWQQWRQDMEIVCVVGTRSWVVCAEIPR
jgi:hypothetical protein